MFIVKGVSAIVVTVLLLSSVVIAHSTQRNALRYLATIDNAVLKTPSQKVHAFSLFDLTFDLHQQQQQVRISLVPNHDVIAEGATVQYLGPDGMVQSTEPINRLDHRVFKGHAWLQQYSGAEWTNVGWARVMIKKDGPRPIFEGVFRVDGDHHHVQTRTHYMQTKHADDPVVEDADEEFMVVWRDSDILRDERVELRRGEAAASPEASCMADGLSFNMRPEHPVYRSMAMAAPPTGSRQSGFWGSLSTRALSGRQIDGQTGGNGAGVNLSSTIGSTAGCATTRKVALVGVATDCKYTASFDSQEAARDNVISQLQSASAQYEDSFNFTLGLQNLTVSDAECPAAQQASAPWNVACGANVTIQDRLNLFSAWRGARPDTNAYWTLLSACSTDTAVGLAWLGQACVTTATTSASSASGGSANETTSGANVVVRTSTEWQVIAHETGHTFGAVHDCTAQTCADGTTVQAQQCCPLSATACDAGARFIMNPATGSGISQFSACSVGNICAAIGRNSVNTTCLVANRDVVTITGSQCGNGVVEAGEDCDCGGETNCGENSCCDGATCRFKDNAVCDPSNDECCAATCQFSSAGTVCRASTGVCDPQEICTGTSGTCPADQTAPDGQSCGAHGQHLRCASGQCTSRDQQCRTLMGAYTSGYSNDTTSCDAVGCQVSCASPQFSPRGTCYSMQQNFLDGTPCRDGAGSCANGACSGATLEREISGWVDGHRTLVIALSAGVGGLLVVALAGCCGMGVVRRKRRRNAERDAAAKNAPPPLPLPLPPPLPHGYGHEHHGRDQDQGQQPPAGSHRSRARSGSSSTAATMATMATQGVQGEGSRHESRSSRSSRGSRGSHGHSHSHDNDHGRRHHGQHNGRRSSNSNSNSNSNNNFQHERTRSSAPPLPQLPTGAYPAMAQAHFNDWQGRNDNMTMQQHQQQQQQQQQQHQHYLGMPQPPMYG